MMSAAVLNPHHAGHERSEDIPRQLRSWSIVVVHRRTLQNAAPRRDRRRCHRKQVPLPLESPLRMATRTVDTSKLWSENHAGVSFAEGVAQRRLLLPPPPSFLLSPRESWSGETAGGSVGRAGGGKVLRALEHEEQRGHRNEDLQDGRRPLRQARRSHHAAIDGRCKRRLWS